MRVLGIAVSPRRNGNSEALLDKALQGAASKGAKIEKIILSNLKVKPCQGDTRCDKNGVCYIKDDMRFLYKKLKKADALIVSSPVYFGSVPAQLKAVIDRCQSVWIENFILKKRKTIKRKGLFICVSGHRRKRFFENSKEVVKTFFFVLGFKLFKTLYAPNLEYKGEALKKKSVLDKAYTYGASLVE